MITVYVKARVEGEPECAPCYYTIRHLRAHALEHRVVEVAPDSDEEADLKRRGISEMPYVVTPHGNWTGYRRERLKGLTGNDNRS